MTREEGVWKKPTLFFSGGLLGASPLFQQAVGGGKTAGARGHEVRLV